MKAQCKLVRIGTAPLTHKRAGTRKRPQPMLKQFTHVNKGRTWTRTASTALTLTP